MVHLSSASTQTSGTLLCMTIYPNKMLNRFHAHPQSFSLFVCVSVFVFEYIWKQDSYLHSLEHDDESQERLSLVPWCKSVSRVLLSILSHKFLKYLMWKNVKMQVRFQLMSWAILGLLSEVVRVLHPQYEMQSLNDTRATEAEGALHQWSESTALRKELSRLREHYRKMHDHSASASSTWAMEWQCNGMCCAMVCGVSNRSNMISQHGQRIEQNWVYLGSCCEGLSSHTRKRIKWNLEGCVLVYGDMQTNWILQMLQSPAKCCKDQVKILVELQSQVNPKWKRCRKCSVFSANLGTVKQQNRWMLLWSYRIGTIESPRSGKSWIWQMLGLEVQSIP